MQGTGHITARCVAPCPPSHDDTLDYAAHLRHPSDLLHWGRLPRWRGKCCTPSSV